MAVIRLNGTGWQDADGLIKVDVGRPVAPADQLARSLAGRDGTVYPEPVMVGGVDGVKFETPSRDMSRPRFAIIVVRDGQAYLIMAAQEASSDVSPALDEVLASWRWTEGSLSPAPSRGRRVDSGRELLRLNKPGAAVPPPPRRRANTCGR